MIRYETVRKRSETRRARNETLRKLHETVQNGTETVDKLTNQQSQQKSLCTSVAVRAEKSTSQQS